MFGLKSVYFYLIACQITLIKFFKKIYFSSKNYNKSLESKTPQQVYYNPNSFLLSIITSYRTHSFKVNEIDPNIFWLEDEKKDQEQMHSFLWLSLIDRKTDHTKIKKIIYIWMLKNSKYRKKTWETSTLSTRIISWILNVDIILNNSTFDFRRNFLNCIISQTNHLKRNIIFENNLKKKIEILIAIILTGLVFKEYEENFDIGIKEMESLVKIFFDNKGFPLSRNPNDLVFFSKYFIFCKEIIKDSQKYIPEFLVNDKEGITIRDLLNHESGLPAFKVYVDELQDRESIIEAVRNEPLEWNPNQKYVYSDLGLILLAEIIEQVSGQRLDSYVRSQLHYPMGMFSTFFTPKKIGQWYAQSIPPTEIDTLFRMELVQADVHDERAYYMDGVAGHAGLFSNTIDIAKYITFLTNQGYYAGRRFISSQRVNEFTSTQTSLSGRGLGFDKKSRSGFSSAGNLMSPESFGHTGFTGTSFWVDPDHKIGVIMLTNRVHPYRSYGGRISRIRAAVADAALESISK